MSYFAKSEYKLLGYRKSKRTKKKYDAILQNKNTKRLKHIPFGDNRYQNYHDKTGLNAYPNLIHGDPKRRKSYKSRHAGDMKDGYYSAGYFAFNILW
jgi:hypothetical protein